MEIDMKTSHFYHVIACLSLTTGLLQSQDHPQKQQPETATERPLREAGERLMQAPQKPWRLGLLVGPIDATLRDHLAIPENSAVMVTECREGEPGYKAGIRKNDIIVSINGRPADSIEPLRAAVETSSRTGESLRLGILQKGQRRELVIKPDMPRPAPNRDLGHRMPNDRPMIPDMSGIMRAQEQMMRRVTEQNGQWSERLDRQEKEMAMLRQQIDELNNALRQMKSEQSKKEKE